MPRPNPDPTPVRYEVRSAVSGAHVCGPYDDESDARHEARRLNKEAASGRTEHQQPGREDGRLNRDPGPIKHMGQPVRYEVVTTGGIALAGEER